MRRSRGSEHTGPGRDGSVCGAAQGRSLYPAPSMCGIAGILRISHSRRQAAALARPPVEAIPERWLDALDASIRHRGPDGFGRFRDRALRSDGAVVDVALVHRRLSIIDLAGGHQPMLSPAPGRGVLAARRKPLGDTPGLGLYESDAASELTPAGGAAPEPAGGPRPGAPSDRARPRDGRVCVVFNGCIYNHRELRAELQSLGHPFSTDHSDTEVLVHGWRQWGDRLYSHLDGMFALAIWDSAAAELALFRDPHGEKPLFLLERVDIERGEEWLAFSSCVPGLTRLTRDPAFTPTAQDAERLRSHWASWLTMGWSNAATPVPGVRPAPHCWWLPYGRLFRRGEDEALPTLFARGVQHRPLRSERDLDEALAESVASRLESDVPLGCFLSGGVDSSLVAHYARARLGSLDTFTVRMPDPAMDESAFARAAAEHLGTTHHEVDAHASPADDLARLIGEIGLPFGDSSLLPAYWVSRAARASVRVALSGDGGDELFLGYERQRAWSRLADSPALRGLIARVPEAWWRALAGARGEKAVRLARACRSDAGYAALLMIFQKPDALRLMPSLDPRAIPGAGRSSGLWRRYDLDQYLPGDLMLKSDSASMHQALEVRAPMLSRDLSRRALQSRLADLMPHGQRKGLLRAVARRYLPPSIVDRPKMGFAVPIGRWFRTDFGNLRTMLHDHLRSAEPFGPASLGLDLDRAYIERMIEEHTGAGPRGVVRDHSQRLYLVLVLSVWARCMASTTPP